MPGMSTQNPPPAPPHRLLLVDDHAVVRHGIAMMLSGEKDLVVAAEAGTIAEALAAIDQDPPDLMVVDITLKEGSGLTLVQEARKRRPGLKALVLSMHDEAEYAEKALRAGALGYVMKEHADEVIIDAIRHVLTGQVFVSADVSARMLKQMVAGGAEEPATGIDSLTEREREIFAGMGEGLTTKKIAEKFGLSARTVEVHRANIKRKMNCEDAAQLLREAVRYVESLRGA
jgi:DNA-binding NarL/FixJ family response regulator